MFKLGSIGVVTGVIYAAAGALAADVLKDPRRLLGLLCDRLSIDFQDTMLSWHPGPRSTDGVWAKHWYAEVEKSTGFRPYQPKVINLPPHDFDRADPAADDASDSPPLELA